MNAVWWKYVSGCEARGACCWSKVCLRDKCGVVNDTDTARTSGL